jgi:oligopeptide/dipeptide ABC transporter ATP-binding protein
MARDVSAPVLQVENLGVAFSQGCLSVQVLHDCSLTLDPGEIVGVVGESGCGKSTLSAALLRLLAANAEITDGAIRLAGRDLLELSEEEMRGVRGSEIAMIFQDPLTSLNPSLTVGRQMRHVAQTHRSATRAEHRQTAVAALSEVGIADPVERLNGYPHESSGGMRQRMLIATALQLEPAVLVADEITSALDVTLERQILELLLRLRERRGTAILFVSHDLGVISTISDRIIVMYAGRIVEQGPTEAVFSRPSHPYTRALLDAAPSYRRRKQQLGRIPGQVAGFRNLPAGCTFADRCAFAREICTVEEPPLRDIGDTASRCHFAEAAGAPAAPAVVELGVTEPAPEPAPAGDSAPLVEITGLRTSFADRQTLLGWARRRRPAGVHAVDGVDLHIARGEILGLVGESGSGKTTLGRTILGLTRASAGTVRFDGREISGARPAVLRRLRSELQMVFQDPHASLSPRMTVSDLVVEPYRIHRIPPRDRLPVAELLAAVELSEEHAEKFPHELSGGQARRVGIARSLGLRPRFIVADEPTAGLDVSAASSILNLMRDLRDRFSLTYLLITHNLNLVGHLADRVAVMYLGQIVEVGPAEQLFESPTHPYTQALLAAVVDPAERTRPERGTLLAAGEIPSPRNPPPGCRYHTRCPLATERCVRETPLREEIAPDLVVACHHWQNALQVVR